MKAHLSGNVCQEPVAAREFYPKHRIGEQFNYFAFDFDSVFSRHVSISGSSFVIKTVCSK